MKQRFFNNLSHRRIDDNGYLFVDESPILKSGILEYYGSELLDGKDSGSIGDIRINPDKIYKVLITEEELAKGADSFKLLPLTDGHEWLGVEGSNAKDYQEGTSGERVTVKGGKIYVPLKFTGNGIIKKIKEDKIEELSASYNNRLRPSDRRGIDFEACDIVGNHIALVERGRCGADVRILNSSKEEKQMARKKTKVNNEVKLIIDGKSVDLEKFIDEEANDEGGVHEESITTTEEVETENTDKREIIREIMAIAAKPAEEFEGGEEEKERTIAEKAEQLAYTDSDDSKTDNEEFDDVEDEAYEDEEEEEVKIDDSCKTHNSLLISKISNAIVAKMKNEAKVKDEALMRAYNSARPVLGDFNAFGMDAKGIYTKALNSLGVALDGKENVGELAAMLKACNSVRKVDNSFVYNAADDSQLTEVKLKV